MKILVTGGQGFVGSHLVESLVKKYGAKNIFVIDNNFMQRKLSFVEGVTYYSQNSWDINSINFPENFDVVFHLGEYSRIVPSFKDIEYVTKSNLHGTSEVLNYCLRHKAKLIYSASSSKFGNNGEDENLSPYSWCKSKAVEMVKNYRRWFDLQFEIAYFYNVYGDGEVEDGDYATVIGIFKRQFQSGKKLTIVSPGTQERIFTHIEDIVDGLMLLMDANKNKEYHLSSDQKYSIIEVAKMFGVGHVLLPERVGERQVALIPSNHNIEKLGWKARRFLKDYIKSIVE